LSSLGVLGGLAAPFVDEEKPMKISCTCLLAALLILASREAPKDYKDVDLKTLGVQLVEAKKDERTGFVAGGKNATSLIQELKEINGQAIADLEKDMRPGAKTTDNVGSEKGFLGPDESLLAVLAADNKFVVDDAGLTHQELARHLRVLAAIDLRLRSQGQAGSEFVYHGRRFKVEMLFARGYQHCPFRDGTKSNTDVTLHNLSNGKKLEYSLLVPDMIERYGFYEGQGTPYRVDPRKILEVLDFLEVKKKP
jgi:hypothetical protein